MPFVSRSARVRAMNRPFTLRGNIASPLPEAAALAAAAGPAMQIPTCEGATMTATARDNAMGRYGEGTTFFACVMPYKSGWALNVHTTFVKASGAFSAATLGATLARTVVGDSSQFIPRTLAAMVDNLDAEAVVGDALADLGHTAQAMQHQAGDRGVVGMDETGGTDAAFDIDEARSAVDQPRAVRALGD